MIGQVGFVQNVAYTQSEGLTHAEVERIVEAATASTPTPQPGLTSADVEDAIGTAFADMPKQEPGLSRTEVEQIVHDAIAGTPEQEPGLTSSEAEKIARGVVASIPPKSAPAEHTKFFVDNALSRYETEGLDATLAYYNQEESIHGHA